jgi:hypothetical protein
MSPSDVCLLSDDGFGGVELIISQYSTHCISKLTLANGVFVSYEVLAGMPLERGDTIGLPTAACFNQPITCTLDRSGDILISDCYNNCIKKYNMKTKMVEAYTCMLLIYSL